MGAWTIKFQNVTPEELERMRHAVDEATEQISRITSLNVSSRFDIRKKSLRERLLWQLLRIEL